MITAERWEREPRWNGWTYDGWGVPPAEIPEAYHDVGNIPIVRALSIEDMEILGQGRGRAMGYAATLGGYGMVKQAVLKLTDAYHLHSKPVTGTLKIPGKETVRLYLAGSEYGITWRLEPEEESNADTYHSR